MARLSLNIYDDNNEIIATYEERDIRWGTMKKAMILQEEIKESSSIETVNKLNDFYKAVFPTITQEHLDMAGFNDLNNSFSQVLSSAGALIQEKN